LFFGKLALIVLVVGAAATDSAAGLLRYQSKTKLWKLDESAYRSSQKV